MKVLTWKDILTNPDKFWDGEIEVQTAMEICRGPIKRITDYVTKVHFVLKWAAYYDITTENWEAAKQPVTVVFGKNEITRFLEPENGSHVVMTGPGFIVALLFPKDGEKLDPSEVEGLDLNNLPKTPVVSFP